jgi:MinD-like ATPase involved in chromosome partitioning or flagellar assembly
MAKGKIVGIIAIKGGVGKTTTVSNLGALLANEFGKKVLIVDANFSAPNLALHLGFINPGTTLSDVLLDRVDVKEAIYEHQLGFHMIPTALLHRKVNPFKLRNKINKLREYYDIILLDSSPTLNEEMLSTIIASDKLFVVTSPDLPTLSCTMHAVRVAKRKKTPIAGIIINKVRKKRFELTPEEVQDTTDVPVVAVLPEDIRVLEALALSTPASVFSPKRDFAVEYKKLAASIIGEEYDDKRLLKRLKEFLAPGKSTLSANRSALAEESKR